VRVLRLLLDSPDIPGGVYQRLHTYLCTVAGGEARPGHEPEAEAAQEYAITQVGWFDLRNAASWDAEVRADPLTCPLLRRIQRALGYSAAACTRSKDQLDAAGAMEDADLTSRSASADRGTPP
jgi:hypothetical protein